MPRTFVDTMAGQTMNLDLSKTLGGSRELTGLCTDLFLIIIRMREAEDLGDPAALCKLINYYIGLFEKNCAALKVSMESITEAKYALIALIDETVLSVPGICRDYWMTRPLQLEHFGDNIAGQEFYNTLQKMLLQPESKKDVLEVYYLCLSLGFEGKYKISHSEERLAIMEDLGRKLRRTRIRASSELSPHGKRADSTILKKKGLGIFPFWVTGALSGGAVVLCWSILYFINAAHVNGLTALIQSLLAK
ncbi:MAG: type IVB secretion system protein IcmH/DotU [Chitinivibrionales bacterium]